MIGASLLLFTFYLCPYQICFSFLRLFLNTRLVLLLTNGLIPTMSLHDHRSGVFSQINCGPSNHDPWSHKMFLPFIIWQEESLNLVDFSLRHIFIFFDTIRHNVLEAHIHGFLDVFLTWIPFSQRQKTNECNCFILFS